MNQYIIFGWLGGNSEMFIHHDFKKGRQVAKELCKSTTWKPVYSGSLVDLITLLEGTKVAPLERDRLLLEVEHIIDEEMQVDKELKEAILCTVRDAWAAAEDGEH